MNTKLLLRIARHSEVWSLFDSKKPIGSFLRSSVLAYRRFAKWPWRQRTPLHESSCRNTCGSRQDPWSYRCSEGESEERSDDGHQEGYGSSGEKVRCYV